MNYHLFSAFLLITFVLVIVPGPIVTFVIATGATRGMRAALITVIGTTLGNAALLACIALGLNWVLKTSTEVFEVLRWAGAAYLIWLGIQSWRTAGRAVETAPPRHHSSPSLTRRRLPSSRPSCRNSSTRRCPWAGSCS
jgi:threonine/homoserine/homoserine lactone efflux protein